jgi:hypothetical protein
MDGIWSGTLSSENLRQLELTRHRLLVVAAGSNLLLGWPADAASGMANLNPNLISPDTHNTVTDKGPEGGPHFVMSGETPDGVHTYGFEFVLFTDNMVAPLVATAPGFNVTIWVLVSNTQDPFGFNTPVWGSFATLTAVNLNEIYHSFDVNATALRFQITNGTLDPTLVNTSIGIAFAEL